MDQSLTSLALSDINYSNELPIFVVEVKPHLICFICNLPCRRPQQLTCGCKTCWQCICDYESDDDGNFKCINRDNYTECEAVQNKRDIVFDPSAAKELAKLPIRCTNSEFGCKEIIPWVNLKRHLNVCRYDCTDCKFNCGQRIRCTLQDEHYDTCPNAIINCKYIAFGCNFVNNPRSIREHYRLCIDEHMNMLLLEFSKFQTEKVQNDDRLATIESDLQIFKSDQTKLLNSVKSGMDQLAHNLDSKLKQVTDMIEDLRRRVHETPPRDNRGSASASSVNSNVDLTYMQNQLSQCMEHLKILDKHHVKMEESLSDFDIRLQCVETKSCDGSIIWRISEYKRRKQEAIMDKPRSLYSQPFYTSNHGYRLCARIYLNGDGTGKNTHVSLFVVIMRGDYDEILSWPFRHRITLALIGIRPNGTQEIMSDTFSPDPTSASFHKPTSPMNVASGCPRFIAHKDIEAPNSNYLINDSIYLKIYVDTLSI